MKPPAPAKPKPKRKRSPAQVVGSLTLERIAVERIKADRYNPRRDLRPGDAAYEQIKRSIAEFGLVDPLVWNKRTGNLVSGHQRLKILRDDYGAEHVAVSVVDLAPGREKVLNLALNKIGGEWDEVALATRLAEIQREAPAALGATGFDDAEISALLLAAEQPTELRPLQVLRPCPRTWVLIGIETPRFGEIAEMIERIAGMDEVFCETTVADA